MGPGTAVFSILPLLLIPVVSRAVPHIRTLDQDSKSVEEARPESGEICGCRAVAYYMPDMAVFLNNMIFNVLLYVLPARMAEFTGQDLRKVILVINLINVSSFLSALVLGKIADKMFQVFNIMIIGNILFYIGCILSFGSTTEFLRFPLEFEVGSMLVGLGDAAVINLAIMSKFVLFEKWGMSLEGLGARSTALNNLVVNLSSAAGVILSGFSLTQDSEIPILGTAGGVFIVVTVGLIFCKLVK